MTFQLDHEKARQLAKALTARTGREIKLKDIYDDIASVFGMKGDAMMHALKNGNRLPARRDFDTRMRLNGKESFMDVLLREMDDRTYWHVAFCVIHVGSADLIREQHGEDAAAEHLAEFASVLLPRGMDDAIFAYLGGTFFLAAWPKLDPESDYGKRVERRMTRIADSLSERPAANACPEGIPYEFAAGAYVSDNLNVDRSHVERWIDKCRERAVKQVRVRRELAAFPRAHFLSNMS